MGSRSGTIGHTADLKFWVEADSLEELFSAAALALSGLMYEGPRPEAGTWLEFSAQGTDFADLLVRLLSEVVYQADAEGYLIAAVKIADLSGESLNASLGVVRLDREIHVCNEPIKAVTYHQAFVAPKGSGWRCEIVLDV
jgi:SHS2 domain-containing protein